MGQPGMRAAVIDPVATDRLSVDLVGRPTVDLLRTDSALCR